MFLRGCSYGVEPARLGGLACLGEMIFIPRSYGIFCHGVKVGPEPRDPPNV